ncbi:hypothetical protein CPB86DRAFT_759903 [Serendipita vermifera]|nr:hypothetical protein CPB86DRAFT_759903 [Serendipita vermifera]
MIGPSLPPHLQTKNEEKVSGSTELTSDVQDDDVDDYGPALPPALAARRTAGNSLVKNRAPTPVMPESDSDDDIGPKLPSQPDQAEPDDAVREFRERERRRMDLEEEKQKPKPLQREEWMLAPPSASDALRSLDPTKIKNRQFSRATGREEVSKDSTLWTETPMERQTRLAEELSGKRKRPTSTTAEMDGENAQKRRKTQEVLKREIDEHTKMTRPSTLLEMHQTAQSTDTNKEPEAYWDRERDMGMGGRVMDQKSRNKMIQDAKSLGDRFGSSKRGAFAD